MAKRARSPAMSSAGAFETFAEDLGHLLSSAQTKAAGWLGQRQQIAEQLTQIRDSATELLGKLGSRAASVAAAVKRGRRVIEQVLANTALKNDQRDGRSQRPLARRCQTRRRSGGQLKGSPSPRRQWLSRQSTRSPAGERGRGSVGCPLRLARPFPRLRRHVGRSRRPERRSSRSPSEWTIQQFSHGHHFGDVPRVCPPRSG